LREKKLLINVLFTHLTNTCIGVELSIPDISIEYCSSNRVNVYDSTLSTVGLNLMRMPVLFFKKVISNNSRGKETGAARQTNV